MAGASAAHLRSHRLDRLFRILGARRIGRTLRKAHASQTGSLDLIKSAAPWIAAVTGVRLSFYPEPFVKMSGEPRCMLRRLSARSHP